MKSYELIVESQQPTCGGKLPKSVEYREIETDDPIAYVRQHEDGLEPVVTEANGELTAEVTSGQHHVVYRFTEA